MRSIPLGSQTPALLVIHSGVSHSLAEGTYAQRRAEFEQASVLLGIKTLRNVGPDQLARLKGEIVVHERATHVVSENERVCDAMAAIERGRWDRLGVLIKASHRSLRDDYEVSCRELELLVELATAERGVYGARMTGGGFGVCVIVLVGTDQLEAVADSVSGQYDDRIGWAPGCYRVQASAGAREICRPMTDSSSQHLHRRRNALTGEWVMVSPQCAQRPWQGEESPTSRGIGVKYDPDCYLCPGNTRLSGHLNAPYTAPWAFDNDFPALGINLYIGSAEADAPDSGEPSALFRSDPVAGRCRVPCYHPDYDKTLAKMTEQEALAVVQLWASEVGALRQSHQWVQVFENRGEMLGCSNAHLHAQIWVVDTLPNEGAKELAQQQDFFDSQGVALLEFYCAEEERLAERLVIREEHWTMLEPYWAMWPFETLLLPRRQIDNLDALAECEQLSLAQTVTRLLRGYDALFDTSCPFTIGWHGAPGVGPAPHWQPHAHFYPPLLRSVGVHKHMVGYEMLSEAQRDLTPEAAAEKLRQTL